MVGWVVDRLGARLSAGAQPALHGMLLCRLAPLTWRWSYSCWKMRAGQPDSVSLKRLPNSSCARMVTFVGRCEEVW